MPDPADIPAVLWRGTLAPEDIPCADASAVMTDDGALLEWLKAGRAYGLAMIDGLPDDAEAGMALAQRIGFLRETNFGTTFDVVSKPDPNNLAYTAHHLPVHTDLTNQETPPGFQFLHCLSNDAVGGGSVFCDGFAVADDIRLSDPEAFSLLCETVIPMRFHDENTDIRHRGTVIRTTDRDVVREIRFNAHLAGIFDLPADEMERYYRAYRTYMAATRSPDYSVSLTLKAGQLVVFDNRRVLHGREAFDPSTGFRRLRGCYVDRGEWNSRIRVLSRRDCRYRQRYRGCHRAGGGTLGSSTLGTCHLAIALKYRPAVKLAGRLMLGITGDLRRLRRLQLAVKSHPDFICCV